MLINKYKFYKMEDKNMIVTIGLCMVIVTIGITVCGVAWFFDKFNLDI